MTRKRRERTLSANPASAGGDTQATDTTTVVTLSAASLAPLRPGRPALESTDPLPDAGTPDAAPRHPEVTFAQPRSEEHASRTDRQPDPPAHRQSGRRSRAASMLRSAARIAAWLIAAPVLGLLPFIIVLRIAVVSYQENVYDGWESLGLGMLAAVALVCVYIAVFMWSFGLRRGLFMPLLNVCLTAMLVYCGFALFHLANSNAKTEEVRGYYTVLHPFLRVAVRNLVFLDPDLVITDLQRTRDDYQRMGLKPRQYSLHFRQPTGFVHAMDLRTNGRSQFNNLIVELYFILMGFETIRHLGTADHIHVSLPPGKRDQPPAADASNDA